MHAQPSLRGTSRRSTLAEQRTRRQSHVQGNPSLKTVPADAMVQASRLGLLAAQRGTGLSAQAFPPPNPRSEQQVMDNAFHPE